MASEGTPDHRSGRPARVPVPCRMLTSGVLSDSSVAAFSARRWRARGRPGRSSACSGRDRRDVRAGGGPMWRTSRAGAVLGSGSRVAGPVGRRHLCCGGSRRLDRRVHRNRPARHRRPRAAGRRPGAPAGDAGTGRRGRDGAPAGGAGPRRRPRPPGRRVDDHRQAGGPVRTAGRCRARPCAPGCPPTGPAPG